MEKNLITAVLVAFLVTVVVVAHPTVGPPAASSHKCVPGQDFLHVDGCNTCFCPKSGLKIDAGCTRMSCVQLDVAVRNQRSVAEAASIETCVPGTSFLHSDNCNTCACPESGLKSQAGCTEKLCLNVTHPGNVHHSSESSESSEHRHKRDANATCEPGTSFMDSENCNRCFCPPSGLKAEAGCTLKLCFNSTHPVAVHVPHSSESSDSSDDRRKRETSSSNESSDETCEEGDKWIASDGCNQCVCPASGKTSEAACTRIGCISPPVKPMSLEDSDSLETKRWRRHDHNSSESHESHEGGHHQHA